MTARLDIDALLSLPEHSALLDAIWGFFRSMPGVIGSFLSGSVARGQMDLDSDLDVGIVFRDAEARSAFGRQSLGQSPRSPGW